MVFFVLLSTHTVNILSVEIANVRGHS